MVCADSTSTSTRRPGACQIWRHRTLIWERRTRTRFPLEGVSHFPGLDVPRLTPPRLVFSHREPRRRDRSLFTPRGLSAATRISAARGVRARMSYDGRKRRIAMVMLQDAWLALYVRGHPA